jgi:hypothetical protein
MHFTIFLMRKNPSPIYVNYKLYKYIRTVIITRIV